MNNPRKFLLDANVFIEAKRRYYDFDLCPGFWECLIWHHRAGRIQSIDRVKTELVNGGNALAQWISGQMPASFFASTNDGAVITTYGQMNRWVQSQSQFLATAKSEFATVADAWLIAYAKVKNLIVVTQEVFDPLIRKKVPIPNICRNFDVECVDTFLMLKELGVVFSWDPPK
jgi:hypothetical protein